MEETETGLGEWRDRDSASRPLRIHLAGALGSRGPRGGVGHRDSDPGLTRRAQLACTWGWGSPGPG